MALVSHLFVETQGVYSGTTLAESWLKSSIYIVYCISPMCFLSILSSK